MTAYACGVGILSTLLTGEETQIAIARNGEWAFKTGKPRLKVVR